MYLSMFVHVTMLQAIRVDGRVDMGVFERIKAHRNSMVVFPGAPPSDSIIKKSQTYIF